MGYVEVIEQQAELVSFWSGPAGIAQCKRAYAVVPPGRFTDWKAVQYDVLRALQTEDVYYVAPPICDLIRFSARTLPTTPLLWADPPTQEGVIFFDGALDWETLGETYEDYDGCRLAFLTWRKVLSVAGPTGANLHGAAVEADNAIALTVYARRPRAAALSLAAVTVWRYGESWEDIAGDDPNVVPEAARYLLAFFRFVAQRVLATSRRPVTNRSVRRRLARTLEHVPEVHVVELRRRDYQQRDESEGTGVGYSCQWLVRGHWHQYHTRGGVQPRWVMPYIKGPSDKPLRVAEKVAYEVVR